MLLPTDITTWLVFQVSEKEKTEWCKFPWSFIRSVNYNNAFFLIIYSISVIILIICLLWSIFRFPWPFTVSFIRLFDWSMLIKCSISVIISLLNWILCSIFDHFSIFVQWYFILIISSISDHVVFHSDHLLTFKIISSISHHSFDCPDHLFDFLTIWFYPSDTLIIHSPTMIMYSICFFLLSFVRFAWWEQCSNYDIISFWQTLESRACLVMWRKLRKCTRPNEMFFRYSYMFHRYPNNMYLYASLSFPFLI